MRVRRDAVTVYGSQAHGSLGNREEGLDDERSQETCPYVECQICGLRICFLTIIPYTGSAQDLPCTGSPRVLLPAGFRTEPEGTALPGIFVESMGPRLR